MRKIAVLDPKTIDKIAAGEVVERPASVVKELVENAIDAGANAITVEIRDGGTKLIRITDNGCGIEKEQLPLAFLRHATSKIKSAEDLTHILSLGFRGEALSSISAVSQVEVLTKAADQLVGSRYIIEGGVEKSLEDIGALDGTTFFIRNLFYNTPARAKFLKTNSTEASYVSSTMEQMALSNPGVAFKYVVNNQTRLFTTGSGKLKDVIYSIYGREITKELVDVHYEKDGIAIGGYVAKPIISRGNRHYENYYVNGRYSKNRVVTKAIEDGYHSHMMQHKYPFTALSIQVQKDILDVNVHPAKKEVRFSNEPLIYNAVFEAVSEAISKREFIPEITLDQESKKKAESNRPVLKKDDIPEPFEYCRREKNQTAKSQTVIREDHTPYGKKKSKDGAQIHEVLMDTFQTMHETEQQNNDAIQKIHNNFQNDRKQVKSNYKFENKSDETTESKVEVSFIDKTKNNIQNNNENESVRTSEINESINLAQDKSIVQKQTDPIDSHEADETKAKVTGPMTQETLFETGLLTEQARSRHRIIGQLFDTYWLVEFEEKLFVIDQHAAHEKVLYEQIMKEYANKEVTSQLLSPPMVISLNMEEETALLDYMDAFLSLGFVIEPFGGKEYAISAIPYNLYNLNEKDLFLEILGSLSDEGSRVPLAMVTDKLATTACKAAVKGNNRLTVQEADALIDELLTLDNPYQCPHGRPTIIAMSKYELEKKFRRIL